MRPIRSVCAIILKSSKITSKQVDPTHRHDFKQYKLSRLVWKEPCFQFTTTFKQYIRNLFHVFCNSNEFRVKNIDKLQRPWWNKMYLRNFSRDMAEQLSLYHSDNWNEPDIFVIWTLFTLDHLIGLILASRQVRGSQKPRASFSPLSFPLRSPPPSQTPWDSEDASEEDILLLGLGYLWL